MRGNLYINSELVEAEITIPLNFISNQLNDLNDKRAGMSGTIILEKNEKYRRHLHPNRRSQDRNPPRK